MDLPTAARPAGGATPNGTIDSIVRLAGELAAAASDFRRRNSVAASRVAALFQPARLDSGAL